MVSELPETPQTIWANICRSMQARADWWLKQARSERRWGYAFTAAGMLVLTMHVINVVVRAGPNLEFAWTMAVLSMWLGGNFFSEARSSVREHRKVLFDLQHREAEWAALQKGLTLPQGLRT